MTYFGLFGAPGYAIKWLKASTKSPKGPLVLQCIRAWTPISRETTGPDTAKNQASITLHIFGVQAEASAHSGFSSRWRPRLQGCLPMLCFGVVSIGWLALETPKRFDGLLSKATTISTKRKNNRNQKNNENASNKNWKRLRKRRTKLMTMIVYSEPFIVVNTSS